MLAANSLHDGSNIFGEASRMEASSHGYNTGEREKEKDDQYRVWVSYSRSILNFMPFTVS